MKFPMHLSKPVSFVILAMLMTFSMADIPNRSDRDHDNVPDAVDRCPNTPLMHKPDAASKYAVLHSSTALSSSPRSVAVDAQGCALDSDGDGIADYQDYCPDNTNAELASGVHGNGCPRQSDGDGTPDYRDFCPDTPRGIKTDHRGCPVPPYS